MAEVKIGRVTHYFGNISVVAIEITDGELAVGDTIHIVGHTSGFMAKVESMQLEHEAVEKAVMGQSIGVRIEQHAREHDEVFKVLPD